MPSLNAKQLYARGARAVRMLQSLQLSVTPVTYQRLGDVIARLANACGMRKAPHRGPKVKRTRKTKAETAAK